MMPTNPLLKPEAPAIAAGYLQKCLVVRLAPGALDWISALCDRIRSGISIQSFQSAFSLAPRKVGKEDLALDDCELAEAATVRPMWQPGRWTVDQAARTLMLLSHNADDREHYVALVQALFASADARELVALYQALPLLPWQQDYLEQAAGGIRSNMSTVFDALARHNPYPFEHFDQSAWNRMVLKAAFTGSTLRDITGINARNNAELALMLWGLVRERRAAERSFPPDIWNLIAPWADTALEKDTQSPTSYLTAADLVQLLPDALTPSAITVRH